MRKAFLNRRWTILITCFLSVLLPVGGAISAETNLLRSPDMLALQGHWVRTDAPYMIELSHATEGSLQAAYFNPKPINVGKTETAEQSGMVQVMIELQDVNYPGSTYVLSYDRTQDLLEGIYFHPESKQSYPVSFVRKSTQQ